jgi:4-hydroxybenzoate polyprenyltransferase
VADHSALWAYSKICRLEYIRGEAPAVFIPALLTASSFEALTSAAVIEGIAVFALLYVTGFMVNALTDRELDLKYDSFKREIGQATEQLGERKVRLILVGHLAAAMGLALHLALFLHQPALFGLVALGVFLALAYSLPPLHLKVRGVAAHAFALALPAFAIPFVFLYIVAAGRMDAIGWAICGAFTLTHYGLTYTNQAYDFDEDQREGVLTPPVRLGLKRSLRASAAMVGVGLPLLAFTVISLALSRDTVAAAWGPPGALGIAVGGSFLLWLGYSVPLRGLSRMITIARSEEVEADAVPRIRASVDYASFHASGIASLAVFGLLIFGATFQAHVVLEAAGASEVHFVGPPLYTVDGAPTGGATADFTLVLHNAGGRALPGSMVFVEVVAQEVGSSTAYFHTRVPLLSAIGAGATPTISIVRVPVHLAGPGCTVSFHLLFDADRDGLSLKSGESSQARLP